MILVLHILVALSSVAAAAYLYFIPSKVALSTSYALVAATFVTGFYLVVSQSVAMLHTCVAGLAYVAIVTATIAAGRQKLASERQKIKA